MARPERDNAIIIKGAKSNNLKNINLRIPRDQLVVLTGISGSGKSSLAFDTIYAEGQRRYVESLSSFARQFLGQMDKPDVDSIEGLSPAISIDQKTTSNNPRSTVGTVTEIYDYLRLLYARVGTPHCPNCGRPVTSQSVDQIIDQVLTKPMGTRLVIMAPVVRGRRGQYKKLLEDFRSQGYARVRIDGEVRDLDEDIELEKNKQHYIEIVIDRLVIRDDVRSRLNDSLETALEASDNRFVQVEFQELVSEDEDGNREWNTYEEIYSESYACAYCNISIGDISTRMFSFNNPLGACPECTGLGSHVQPDPELIVEAPGKSLNDGAINGAGWKFAEKNSWARSFIEALATRYDFSLDTPWDELSEDVHNLILYGNNGEKIDIDTSNSRYNRGEDYQSDWEGVVPSVMRRYNSTNSGDLREYYEEYMSEIVCESCNGARLRPESLGVTFKDKNIFELTQMNISQAKVFIVSGLDDLSPQDYEVAKRINDELEARLQFLVDVGLDYMTLDRSAGTLSGGEAQRIRLATQIGSGLTGVLYVLDEPSIGLHQRDNRRLLKTLEKLRDLGNTVIIVEHDEETMFSADYIVDIGIGAGLQGGEVVAAGDVNDIMACEESVTGQYLRGDKKIPIPEKRREGSGKYLEVTGASLNNLKNIDVKIPLGTFTTVSGVSGSGKSSLVNGVILPVLEANLNRARRKLSYYDTISGYEHLDKVISIDQSPIGRTPRSNPATYTGVFDAIRDLFAATPLAKQRGYKKGRFSFNVRGGRCEACKGDGVNRIEMQFLSDMYVPCDVCGGSRYNKDTLEVSYKGKNIAEVLDMQVDEALEFFENIPKISKKLQTLFNVGLGYIKLGQPSTQLSGGEAQRVKLATELSRTSTGKTFYILDEPTTGLHMADVDRLVDVLQRLTSGGNTVLVIEHNLDVIKAADYIIDLGPEGGDAGGTVIATGKPEEISQVIESYTGYYIGKLLEAEAKGLKSYEVFDKNQF